MTIPLLKPDLLPIADMLQDLRWQFGYFIFFSGVLVPRPASFLAL